MKASAVRSKGVTALCTVVLATACCGAAISDPISPTYLDLPIAPSAFIPHSQNSLPTVWSGHRTAVPEAYPIGCRRTERGPLAHPDAS
jgi:hypothetical protein